jgi:hypothetical protein
MKGLQVIRIGVSAVALEAHQRPPCYEHRIVLSPLGTIRPDYNSVFILTQAIAKESFTVQVIAVGSWLPGIVHDMDREIDAKPDELIPRRRQRPREFPDKPA